MRTRAASADVARFNDWLDAACAANGVDETLAADIKLCLNEVLANLMSYGLKQASRPLTVVELTLGPGCGQDISWLGKAGFRAGGPY